MRTASLGTGHWALGISHCFLVLIFLTGTASYVRAQELPTHPSQIPAAELSFTPPSPASHRVRLANGLTAYLVPDRSLPVVRARAYVRTGAAFDPKGKEGLTTL